jgi:hypothetical protein
MTGPGAAPRSANFEHPEVKVAAAATANAITTANANAPAGINPAAAGDGRAV